jgi:hypothetical protein
LVAGAAAEGLLDHQFILGGDLEHSGVDPGVVHLGLQAHFVLGAFGRFQAEIEALDSAWRVGHFGLGRRFEAFACADVAVQLGRECIHHAHGWSVFLIGLAAAGVAVAQELIIDIHLHGAVTYARLQGPAVEGPVGLDVGVKAARRVDFIAA